MCGRTACTLAPDDVCKACTFQDKMGKKTQPQWRDAPGGQKYYTSYNVAPTSYTPVLLSGEHFKPAQSSTKPEESSKELDTETSEENLECEVSEFVIQPMQWGLIPSWHSGDPKSTGYNMINARSDGVMDKRTYKVPLQKGRRCVVIVDGYYEWQKKDGKKQPYFIYMPQGVATEAEDVKTDDKEPSPGGRRILTLAGIFDRWRPKDGGEPIYSYSIITTESHKSLSWLHDRMPAILKDEDEVREWLQFGSVPLDQAMKLIRPTDVVSYHPVSDTVNSVKNKSPDCIKKIDPQKTNESQSSKFMSAWLSKGQAKKRPSTEGSEVKVEGSEVKAEVKEESGEPAAKKTKQEKEEDD